MQRNYRVWAAPVVIVMAFMGLVLNLSYELLALTVPLTVLVIVLQPREGESWWQRWRAAVTVLAGLVVTYSALFVWIRWRISEMACQATDTCYAGTVVKLDRQALWNNASWARCPGGPARTSASRPDHAGRAYPQANAVSIGLAVLGAALMLALWATWVARRRTVNDDTSSTNPRKSSDDDTRGLLMVLVVSLSIAAGTTVITGITERAVGMLETSMLSYRTNVVAWTALALAAVTVVRLLMISAGGSSGRWHSARSAWSWSSASRCTSRAT